MALFLDILCHGLVLSCLEQIHFISTAEKGLETQWKNNTTHPSQENNKIEYLFKMFINFDGFLRFLNESEAIFCVSYLMQIKPVTCFNWMM